MREKEPWDLSQEGHGEDNHIKLPSSTHPGYTVNCHYPAVQVNE